MKSEIGGSDLYQNEQSDFIVKRQYKTIITPKSTTSNIFYLPMWFFGKSVWQCATFGKFAKIRHMVLS